MYPLLDKFFLVVHTLFIVFNLLGWVWTRTRRWHLVCICLTGFSWGVLGIWYGLGYCPLTEWHWQVREAMGDRQLPQSFVKYLLDGVTGLDMDAMAVDVGTAAGFFGALAVSIGLNVRDIRTARRERKNEPRETLTEERLPRRNDAEN